MTQGGLAYVVLKHSLTLSAVIRVSVLVEVLLLDVDRSRP